MDDRRPIFVTAIGAMTGLSGGETIPPISKPFNRFDIILVCPRQTKGRCRSYCCCWIAAIVVYLSQINIFFSSSYAKSCFKNIMNLCDRPLVCLRHWEQRGSSRGNRVV